MAVAYGSSHGGGDTVSGTSITVSGVTGGTDQAYAITIGTHGGTSDVSTVTGGGLTWTKRKEKSSGRNTIHGEVWTAYGTPNADPFDVTVTLAAAVTARAAVVDRFTDADPNDLQTWVVANTNGIDGAETGGTDSTPATIDKSVSSHPRLVTQSGIARTNWSVAGKDADYTAGAVESRDAGGGSRIDTKTHYRLVTSGTPFTDTIAHGLGAVSDWIMFATTIAAPSAVSKSGSDSGTGTDASSLSVSGPFASHLDLTTVGVG